MYFALDAVHRILLVHLIIHLTEFSYFFEGREILIFLLSLNFDCVHLVNVFGTS